MGSPRAISTSGLVLAMLVLAAGPARAGDGEEPLGTPPANDNFANAQPLSGSTARASGTNEDATSEPGEPDHADGEGHSVWYRWTAPASGRVIVDTCDSDFDTTMAVYTGGAVNALTRVAANDDGCNDEQSRVTFNATRGTTYWIAIDTFIDEGGDIVLALGPVPKPRPGRYSGLTEPPAPRRVKFLLSSTGRSVTCGSRSTSSAGSAASRWERSAAATSAGSPRFPCEPTARSRRPDASGAAARG
jgi:hypothetical protein